MSRTFPTCPTFSAFTIATALALILLAVPAGAAWEYGDWADVFDFQAPILEIAVSSDGAGGMVVAVQNQDLAPDRVQVSRVDHVGTEIWGQEGFILPIDIQAQWQAWPIDVAPAGSGGAFCTYRESFTTYHMIKLTRVSPEGTIDWIRSVENIGIPQTYSPDVKLVTTPSGGVIVAWTHDPARKLRAAAFDGDGNLQWHNDINQLYDHERVIGAGTYADWHVAPDGSGGLLATWLRDNGVPEVGVQRIDSNGVAQWGADGQLLWAGFGWGNHDPRVLTDGAGGAIVAVSAVGRVVAQRINSAGAPLWGTGTVVHDSQTSLFNLSTHPEVAPDGLGGFVVVHGNEDMFAQRVDVNGATLWGNGVVLSNAPGLQQHPDIVGDGSGGFLISFEDYYWATCPGECWRTLSGMRLDGFGNAVWSQASPNAILYSAWNYADPQDVRVVADGSGGMLLAWQDEKISDNEDVRAKGVGPNGDPPKATLSLLIPDAGAPGGTGPVGIFGDYLETDLDLFLRKPGSPDIPITDLTFVNYQTLAGTGDLTGADPGPYDLIVSRAGVHEDTLRAAFGVGEPLPCEGDEPMPDGGGQQEGEGSRRRVAFDAEGWAHAVWLERYGSQFVVVYASAGPDGWSAIEPFYDPPEPLRHPCLAVSPDGTVHVAFVREFTPTQQQIIYARRPPGGGFDFYDTIPGGTHSHPVMAVDAIGRVHIVYESGAPGATSLHHAYHDGDSFSSPVDTGAGPNARLPDLDRFGDGNDLLLTYARNSFIPGVHEACYQHWDAAFESWDAPVVLGFGAAIGSPSVAWGGGPQSALFAFTADFFTGSHWLYTAHLDQGTLGATRFRVTEANLYAVSVQAANDGTFYLMTEESSASLPRQVLWRSGDGEVFYPKRRLNSNDDVEHAYGAVSDDGTGLVGFWLDHQSAESTLASYRCFEPGTGIPIAGVPAPPSASLACAPNPFNPATTVSFELPAAGRTSLSIYDVQGRLVRRLVDGVLEAGPYAVRWDGTTDSGRQAASGIYLVRLFSPVLGSGLVTKIALVE